MQRVKKGGAEGSAAGQARLSRRTGPAPVPYRQGRPMGTTPPERQRWHSSGVLYRSAGTGYGPQSCTNIPIDVCLKYLAMNDWLTLGPMVTFCFILAFKVRFENEGHKMFANKAHRPASGPATLGRLPCLRVPLIAAVGARYGDFPRAKFGCGSVALSMPSKAQVRIGQAPAQLSRAIVDKFGQHRLIRKGHFRVCSLLRGINAAGLTGRINSFPECFTSASMATWLRRRYYRCEGRMAVNHAKAA